MTLGFRVGRHRLVWNQQVAASLRRQLQKMSQNIGRLSCPNRGFESSTRFLSRNPPATSDSRHAARSHLPGDQGDPACAPQPDVPDGAVCAIRCPSFNRLTRRGSASPRKRPGGWGRGLPWVERHHIRRASGGFDRSAHFVQHRIPRAQHHARAGVLALVWPRPAAIPPQIRIGSSRAILPRARD